MVSHRFQSLSRPMIVLLSLFILMKLLLMVIPHQVLWDEAVYIGMGKYLYSGGEVGLWEEIRPLGLPVILGLVWFFGLPLIFFSEVVILLFSVGSLVLVYFIGRDVFDENTGFLSALFFAITPVFFLYSSYILTGVSSTFFSLLAVYLFLRHNNRYLLLFFAGVFSGFSFLFRFPQGLVLVGLCVAVVLGEKKLLSFAIPSLHFVKSVALKGLMIACGFFVSTLPYFIFNFYSGSVFGPLLNAGGHQSNATHAVSNAVFDFLFYVFHLSFEHPLLLFCVVGVYAVYLKKKPVLLTVPLFLFLYFSLIVNKQMRFSLVFLPYICLLAGVGCLYVWNSFVSYRRIVSAVFAALFLVSLFHTLGDYGLRVEYPANDFHTFFAGKDIGGPVLTTDPVFAAHSDILLYPFYDNIEQAAVDYERFHFMSQYVVYDPQFYPCFNEQDCVFRSALFGRVLDENEIIFELEGKYILRNPMFS